MKYPLWFSFCVGVFMGFMTLIMLTVTITMLFNVDEKLITDADVKGSVIYMSWFGMASLGFLGAAYSWHKRWWFVAVPCMLAGFAGFIGCYAYFAGFSG